MTNELFPKWIENSQLFQSLDAACVSVEVPDAQRSTIFDVFKKMFEKVLKEDVKDNIRVRGICPNYRVHEGITDFTIADNSYVEIAEADEIVTTQGMRLCCTEMDIEEVKRFQSAQRQEAGLLGVKRKRELKGLREKQGLTKGKRGRPRKKTK